MINKKWCPLILLMFLIIISITVHAQNKEELKLYKNFYYGEAGEEVYKKIIGSSDLRQVNLENSYEEWYEAEKYSTVGGMKVDKLNEYFHMDTRVKLFENNFTCRFRFDKQNIKLQRVIINGPDYLFEKETEEEITAFKKMFTLKYNEPDWDNINEQEMEIESFANIKDYTWKYIWEIESERGKKEIKVGLLKFVDGQEDEYYSSVLSIGYTIKLGEPEKIGEEQLEDIIEDF